MLLGNLRSDFMSQILCCKKFHGVLVGAFLYQMGD